MPCFTMFVWLLLRATTACTFRHLIFQSGPNLVCFVHFDLEMCFTPQQRALLYLSSGQLAPHPPLQQAYFSTLQSHKSLEKHSESRLSCLFAHLHLLSSLIFSLLFFSSLTLPTFAFPTVHIVGNFTSKLPSIIRIPCQCVCTIAYIYECIIPSL